jgi:hypothetical protein
LAGSDLWLRRYMLHVTPNDYIDESNDILTQATVNLPLVFWLRGVYSQTRPVRLVDADGGNASIQTI